MKIKLNARNSCGNKLKLSNNTEIHHFWVNFLLLDHQRATNSLPKVPIQHEMHLLKGNVHEIHQIKVNFLTLACLILTYGARKESPAGNHMPTKGGQGLGAQPNAHPSGGQPPVPGPNSS